MLHEELVLDAKGSGMEVTKISCPLRRNLQEILWEIPKAFRFLGGDTLDCQFWRSYDSLN